MATNPVAANDLNASLLLTKRIKGNLGDFKSKTKLEPINAITRCIPSPGYRKAYERWNTEIHGMPGVTLAARFKVDGRLVTGLGAPNVLEFSVAMNRLWGMPIIHGTGLKGLISHYARSHSLSRDSSATAITEEQMRELFGSEEIAGAVDWLDAWYIPGSKHPFLLDGNTPHNGAWSEDPSTPPTGFQDPIPSNFVSVRGSFLVAVRAPSEQWAIFAMNQITRALDEWGAGAKTNAGYGYLTFQYFESEWMNTRIQQIQDDLEATTVVNERKARIQAVLDEIVDPRSQPNLRASSWIQAWEEETDDETRLEIGSSILARLSEQPSLFHKLTGRPIKGYAKAPASPRGYMVAFLEWVDVHLAEGFGGE